MWTSQTTADGRPTDYGYGWGIGNNPGRRIVSHSGNQAGASSMFIVDTTNRLALAIMSNLEDADLAGIRGVLTGPLSPTGKYTTRAAAAAALAPDEYRAVPVVGPTRYSGRMIGTADGERICGTMVIEQPVRIHGQVAGTLKGQKRELRDPYTMRADGCVGEVTISATFAPRRDTAEGSALITGACVPQPVTGTLYLSRK